MNSILENVVIESTSTLRPRRIPNEVEQQKKPSVPFSVRVVSSKNTICFFPDSIARRCGAQ